MSATQPHGFAVDGFALTGFDEFGCLWTVSSDIAGWFTPNGSMRTSAEPRSQQNGDWRGTGFRSGRVITLSGLVKCPDAVAMEMAGRRLSAVLAHGGFGEFVGESDAGTWSSKVQLEDLPLFDALSDSTAKWQLTFGSDDPLLYGPSVSASTTLAGASGTGRVWPRVWPRDWGVEAGTTPGAAQLPNAGTAGYFPSFRIDGPVPNPVVTMNETGEWVRYNGTVAAGQWLEVDCARRRVLLNGSVDVTFAVTTSATWPSVPPGGVSVSVAADAADPSALVTAFGFEGAWS